MIQLDKRETLPLPHACSNPCLAHPLLRAAVMLRAGPSSLNTPEAYFSVTIQPKLKTAG